MKISVSVPINSTKEEIWKVITNIENANNNISGIEKIEILEKPENGLVGLKWRETRTMFGKTATEIMWIIEAEENSYYKTQAESHGAIYNTIMAIEEGDNESHLSMEFMGQAQTLGAKIMSTIFSPMVKSSTKKAIQKDLQDIKEVVEGKK